MPPFRRTTCLTTLVALPFTFLKEQHSTFHRLMTFANAAMASIETIPTARAPRKDSSCAYTVAASSDVGTNEILVLDDRFTRSAPLFVP